MTKKTVGDAMRITLVPICLFLGFVFGCSMCERAPNLPKVAAPIVFEEHYSIETKYSPATHTLVVFVKLDNGFHAYATGESVGIPVDLIVLPQNGWALSEKPSLPKGQEKALKQGGKSVVLTNNFHIEAKLVPGVGPGQGILKLQICTDSACDRPREHALTWSTSDIRAK